MSTTAKITTIDDITLVNLFNIPTDLVFLSEVLGVFASQNINIDMISQTSPSSANFNLSFTVSGSDLEKTLTIVSALKENHPGVKISANSGNCKIALFDADMYKTSGVAYRVMKVLSDIEISPNLITTSDNEISLLVSSICLEQVETELKREFGI